MRVAHITTVHHPEDPRIFWKQCSTIAAAGHEVFLLAQHDEDTIRNRVRILGLTPTEGRYRRLPLLFEAFSRARELQADIYHIHDPELIPVGWLLKKKTRARLIYDMHEDYRWNGVVEGTAIRLIEQWAFGWVDHVIVANQHEAWIPEQSGAENTVVANYPLSAEQPNGQRAPSDPMRLVYTGVISEERGLGFMMDIARVAKERSMPLYLDVRGVCNYKEQLNAAIERHQSEHLSGTMRKPDWSSYVPWGSLSESMRRADVGLLLLEPLDRHNNVLPTKLYEYMQAGLPVLITDAPVWREFIEEHDCGAAVAYGDADRACEILMQWKNDPEEYARLSQNARKAAQLYRWEEMGERLLSVYDKLGGHLTE